MSGTSTNFTQTPNLGLFKPVYAADAGYWGTHLNANADKLDGLFGVGGTLPYVPISGGTMTGKLTLSGNATANLQPVTLQQQNTALGAYLPLSGGHMTGYMTSASAGASHPTLENLPTLDFLGTCITFQRQITNATANEVGANPKVVVQLNNNCSNYTVQPWGGYDGPTAFFVNATNTPSSAGSVVATWSQITSQGNNPYTAQDTAHLIRVIKTGQNSCWGIALQHQDATGLSPQAFATMGVELAFQINGPEPQAQVQFDCTYSNRQGMSFIPSVNPTPTWAARQTWPAGTLTTGTPSGGVNTVYIAQNNGTTGATQPVWPTSGTVVDGTITWQTGVAAACELGVGILMGGGRPMLPNTIIWTGIGFNHVAGNACIDTTRATMLNSKSAAIRLAEGQIIDFTGGGALANQNRRTFGYSDALSGMALIMNNGLVASTWADDGTFVASHNLRLAGNSNLSGVTKADSGSLTIGKNLAGSNEIDLVVGLADVINLYGTDMSGNINVPAPFITLGQANSTFAGNVTVNGRTTLNADLRGNAGQSLGSGGNFWGYGIFSSAVSGVRTGGDSEYFLIQTTSDTIDAPAGLIGLHINLHSGGTGTSGNRVGQWIETHHTGSTLDKARGYNGMYAGQWIYAYGEGSAGGTAGAGNSFGSLWGGLSSARLMSGATYWNEACGHEIDVGVASGASAAFVRGLKVIIQGNGQAAQSSDIMVGLAKTSLTDQPMMNGIVFGSLEGYWPIAPAGTLIGTQPSQLATPPAMTATNGIDLSAVTFSGMAFKSNGFQVDANGYFTGAGGSLTNALHFTALSSSPTDLTHGLDLNVGAAGMTASSGNATNFLTGGGGVFVWYIGGSNVGTLGSSGLNSVAIGQSSAAAGSFSSLLSFTSITTGGTGGPTWTTGAGAPSATAPAGSLYSRTAGATGTRLYVSAGGGTWNAVAGV